MSNQGDGGPPQGHGQQGNTGGQWSGGQQPWSTGGQSPSWSTGETGPNVGPTMNNPQSSYYDRFSEASGEGVITPQQGGGGGGKRGKVLLGLAAALVIVIAAVAVFAFTRGGEDKQVDGAPSKTSSLPPVTATTWVNPTKAAGVRALQSGWVSVVGSEHMHGQYDVPDSDDWKLGKTDTMAAYMNKKGDYVAAASAVSQYGIGYCSSKKNLESAWVGLRGAGKSDPTSIGATQAENFADGIAASMHNKPGKKGKLSAAKQIKVDQGSIPAIEYTITTTAGDPGKCDKGKTFEVRTVTFSAQGQTYQFVTMRTLGVKKELSQKSLEEIISTFRPAS